MISLVALLGMTLIVPDSLNCCFRAFSKEWFFESFFPNSEIKIYHIQIYIVIEFNLSNKCLARLYYLSHG